MGEYLNPDNLGFKTSVNSEIYIDKSLLIKNTNKILETNDKYVCVSRPRRFGKSVTAEMLTAYYSRGCNSNDLFSNLKISDDPDFEKHLNKYNVIHLNIDRYLSEAENVKDIFDYIYDDILEEAKIEFENIKTPRRKSLYNLVKEIYNASKIPCIFIIDEWDCIFRRYKDKKDEHEKYLDFLKALLKDNRYIALTYMTGILPIKKYGVHSALNMFNEISMINPREFAEFTGFTEEEVKYLCKKYEMPYEETKKWYNGYNVRGISIYNPRSVVMSMTGHDFHNYWTSTETYEALETYIEMNFDGLRDSVILLLAGEKVKVKTDKFTNDMVTFKSKDDVLTLLIHLGYLTYDEKSEEAWIPNNEILKQFAGTIEDMNWTEISKSLILSEQLLNATLNCREEKVAQLIDEAHSDNASVLKYNDENSLACTLTIAYYSARNYYNIYRELPTGKGYADLVFVPRKNVDKPAMVIELKYDKSAETAITQIKNRNYVEGLKNYKGEVLLIGINYEKSDSGKKHECKIEKIFK